jgi:hypothetical protein
MGAPKMGAKISLATRLAALGAARWRGVPSVSQKIAREYRAQGWRLCRFHMALYWRIKTRLLLKTHQPRATQNDFVFQNQDVVKDHFNDA